MWTTVYVAMGRNQSEAIIELAKKEGFYVKKQYFGKEGQIEMFEIVTLESEAEEFYELLLENNII